MGLSSRQRMWAERSHLHIRSLWDGNKGRAGWINEFNDVPASQLSLSPIGLSAACCSVCWRCCDVAASLERTAESFTPIPLNVFCKKRLRFELGCLTGALTCFTAGGWRPSLWFAFYFHIDQLPFSCCLCPAQLVPFQRVPSRHLFTGRLSFPSFQSPDCLLSEAK